MSARGTIQVDADKTLWEVEYTVTRTTHFWVAAEDYETAYGDAEVLASHFDDSDFEEVDEDVDVVPARNELQPDQTFWSGGPQGSDVLWSQRGGAA